MAGKMLPLNQLLGALDRRDKKYYENLSDEDKKAFAPYLLLRYASNVESDQFFTEHYVTTTNELININYWELSKHPKLQWLLFSMIGAYQSQRHPWLKAPSGRGSKKSEIQEALADMYPLLNDRELGLLESNLSKEQAKKFLDEYKQHRKQR